MEGSQSSSASRAAHGQQGVMWFSNVYPPKANKFDFRQELTHKNHERIIPELLPPGVEVVRMVPREREGGAFVYFRAPPAFVLQTLRKLAEADGAKEQRFMKKEDILAIVCSGISRTAKKHDVRAFLCPHPVRAHRVLGAPYLEDLQSRFPSARLRVRVDPPGALSEERIFDLLRHYGELQDIEKLPDNKGFSASFNYTAAAVAARNCLHRARIELEVPASSSASAGVEGAPAQPKLHIEFEAFMQKWVREAIVSNARFSIPLIAAMLLGTTYFIWDPLRRFAVQVRLAVLYTSQSESDPLLSEGDTPQPRRVGGVWGLLVHGLEWYSQGRDSIYRAAHYFQHDTHQSLTTIFWARRKGEVKALRRWLLDPQDRVLLFTGHRGNGQSAVIREVLGLDAVYIDVAAMLEAGGAVDDRIFMRHLCRAVGYWPAGGMDKQMTMMMEMMMPGSSKLSRENEILVSTQRVFSSTTQALTAWRNRWMRRDAHSSPPLPLIVIDGFTAANKDRRPGFFDAIVTWAAYISENRLARVLFIADSSFAEPAMVAALGNRPERFDVQELMDAESIAVQSVFLEYFGKDIGLTEQELRMVGGRFRDVATLASMITEGAKPKEAVTRLVEGAEKTVRNLLMRGQQGAKWTRPQLWRAVQLLALIPGETGVPYDVFLYNVFRGDEAAMQSMKESGLITVARRGETMDAGELPPRCASRHKVVPGSPLFAEVFWRLSQHKGLAAVLDLEVAKEDIKREQGTLDGYEADLVRLQQVDDVRRDKWRSLDDPNQALRKRKVQLLDLISEQQKKLEAYHKARRDALATMGERKKKFNASAEKERGRRVALDEAKQADASSRRGGFLHRWSFGLL